jgi:nucleotide-binding universal stress UspA family protein
MRGHSRVSGIVLGSAASAAVHRSPVPVLVARRPPEGIDFPSRILLASDGTPMSDAAVEMTARIAARHGAHVAIIGAHDHEAPFRPGLAEHATQIMEATGTEPLILDEPGPPHRAVAKAARHFDASLVVTGSRA